MMDPSVQFDRQEGTNFLRNIIRKNLGDSYQEGIFPGPMAVQLSRTSLHLLSEHDYYITEKSDGIRAMCLMLRSKEFPRWVHDSDNTQQFDLKNNCAIECIYHHAKQAGKDTTLKVTCMENTNLQYLSRTNTVLLIDTVTNSSIKLKRLKGWSFSFFFDRTFEFYLSIEEIAFPSRDNINRKTKTLEECRYQDIVILDGEIVFNLKEQRNNYSIYDLITFCKEKVISARAESMNNRYEFIEKYITDPHYHYYKIILKRDPPKCLKLIRKHFYEKSKLMEVMECIKEDPETGEYLYKNYNKNDGLVFTPKDAVLSAFKPGANNYLLKWKWPNKLTCDFLVSPDENSSLKEHAEGANDNLFHVYFQFSKISHFFDTVQVKDISPHILAKFLDLQKGTGLIVEMGFDSTKSGWYFLLIREDKTSPNAFKTVANTVENMIENITIDDLKHYISPNSNSDNYHKYVQSRGTFTELYRERVIRMNQVAYFRLQHVAQKLSLQFCIKGDEGDIWRVHCMEVDVDANFVNTIDLSSIRNRNEQIAKAYFHPLDGRYKIIELVDSRYAEYCEGSFLLKQLLKMESTKNEIQKRLKREDNPTNNSKYEPSQKKVKQ
ncbi:predicted protein [Naegleria gruberi]|uniref:mRNA guanylyltransferase n=1 Tax=Naegleria gruberi TaxID=5762 RepID=D2W3M4_NAEGR|nr:uncharacterized protein NAEGRDRAFT_54448 [Naegleria gruberi]EFC36360.1 predicted protein [Naegleria gruberi]|eukprot:XP_002669104.1 predicted protein [Naegleria gruberi strain NEG-M]